MNTVIYDANLKLMASLGLKKEAHTIQVQLECLRHLANDLMNEVDELKEKLKKGEK